MLHFNDQLIIQSFLTYCSVLLVRYCLQELDVDNHSTNLLGYNRGGYNQNRWGTNYRDGGSGGRGGYNRNQQSVGSYNHNRQGSYNKSSSGASGGYSQSQVPGQGLHYPRISLWIQQDLNLLLACCFPFFFCSLSLTIKATIRATARATTTKDTTMATTVSTQDTARATVKLQRPQDRPTTSSSRATISSTSRWDHQR